MVICRSSATVICASLSTGLITRMAPLAGRSALPSSMHVRSELPFWLMKRWNMLVCKFTAPTEFASDHWAYRTVPRDTV